MRARLSSLIANPTMPTFARFRWSSATAVAYGSACCAAAYASSRCPSTGRSAAFDDVGDHHVSPPADQLDLGQRFRSNSVGCRRIAQAAQECLVASVSAPNGKEIGEPRLISDVRIAVERGVASRRARGRHTRERVVELSPVARSLCLEVRDLERAVRAACDGDRLVDRLEHVVVFVAHVRRVRKSGAGERLAQRDQLLARREGAWRVLESRRNAARAVRQRGANESLHARQLVRGRWTIVSAHHDVANRSESDHRRDVDRRLHARQRAPEIAKRVELIPRVITLAAANHARRA